MLLLLRACDAASATCIGCVSRRRMPSCRSAHAPPAHESMHNGPPRQTTARAWRSSGAACLQARRLHACRLGDCMLAGTATACLSASLLNSLGLGACMARWCRGSSSGCSGVRSVHACFGQITPVVQAFISMTAACALLGKSQMDLHEQLGR